MHEDEGHKKSIKIYRMRQREHHERTGDKEIKEDKGGGGYAREKPNRVVKCPHHTENMRETESKSVSGKRDKESRRKKNT